jgi:hypothetical protein
LRAEFNAHYSLQSCAKNQPLNVNIDTVMTVLAILPKKVDLGFFGPARLRSWRQTEGGDLSMGLPTSSNKTDVLRHRWMRWSVIIMHRLGLIRELIAAGFMHTDVTELPLGHPGRRAVFLEFGVGYSTASWVEGKQERTIVGDESPLVMGFDPSRGGQNQLLHDEGMPMLMTTLKSMPNITGFFSATLSNQQLPPCYVFPSQAKTKAPKYPMPVCQRMSIVGNTGKGLTRDEYLKKFGHPCDCIWRDADGNEIVHSSLRTMSFAIAEKADPMIRTEIEGRSITRCVARSNDRSAMPWLIPESARAPAVCGGFLGHLKSKSSLGECKPSVLRRLLPTTGSHLSRRKRGAIGG